MACVRNWVMPMLRLDLSRYGISKEIINQPFLELGRQLFSFGLFFLFGELFGKVDAIC
jgi:hypothetical protein